jgi:hypothetical protein
LLFVFQLAIIVHALEYVGYYFDLVFFDEAEVLLLDVVVL